VPPPPANMAVAPFVYIPERSDVFYTPIGRLTCPQLSHNTPTSYTPLYLTRPVAVKWHFSVERCFSALNRIVNMERCHPLPDHVDNVLLKIATDCRSGCSKLDTWTEKKLSPMTDSAQAVWSKRPKRERERLPQTFLRTICRVRYMLLPSVCTSVRHTGGSVKSGWS